MFDASPDPSADDSPPLDPTIEVCERHLRLLQEVAEIAMEVTRASGKAAAAGARAAEDIVSSEGWCSEADRARAFLASKDAAEAFHKVTRALRLTLALEKATAETLRDLRAGVVAERKTAAQAPAAPGRAAISPLDGFRDKVRDLVTDAIAAAGDISPARELSDDLRERLTEADRFGPLLLRPLREAMEKVFLEMGMAPDWLGLFGDELNPPPPRPPPKWTITGPPNSPELRCVRRETPQPPIPKPAVPRRE